MGAGMTGEVCRNDAMGWREQNGQEAGLGCGRSAGSRAPRCARVDNAVLIERGNASASTEIHQWRRICNAGATGRDRSNGAARCPAVI